MSFANQSCYYTTRHLTIHDLPNVTTQHYMYTYNYLPKFLTSIAPRDGKGAGCECCPTTHDVTYSLEQLFQIFPLRRRGIDEPAQFLFWIHDEVLTVEYSKLKSIFAISGCKIFYCTYSTKVMLVSAFYIDFMRLHISRMHNPRQHVKHVRHWMPARAIF